MKKCSFGSDNHSGVHPSILEAIERANEGYCFGYGEDEYTEGVLRQIEALLGGDCKALFVLNGTGANVVSLASFLKPFSTILAPSCAHIIEDECGAVERFSSCRITPLPQEGGKVKPETVKEYLKFGDQHKVQPAILSMTIWILYRVRTPWRTTLKKGTQFSCTQGWIPCRCVIWHSPFWAPRP